jgi:hypothetical protein
MMKADTSTIESKSPELAISEQSEDTPRSLDQARRVGIQAIMLLASTQIFDPSHIAFGERLLLHSDATGQTDDQAIRTRGNAASDQPLAWNDRSDAESANKVRLALLARSYVAGQMSTEEEARLAIVTERVRRLIPRVTAEDMEALEGIAQDVARIRANDSARRQRLGII